MARSVSACTTFVAIFLVLGAAGCASRGTPPARLSYIQAFETGQYKSAYDDASRVAEKSTGASRNEAALVAGLSAQALNMNAEAVRWLRPLSTSPDPTLAGKSNAALGLISLERSEHADAARHLHAAADQLTGDESARAFMYEGDALAAAGKHAEASAAYASAQRQVAGDASLRSMIEQRLKAGSTAPTGTAAASPSPSTTTGPTLTVQVGAWSNLATARRQAQKLASTANVRIVPILKDGHRLYAVRVGKFSNRDAAEQVKSVVGGNAVVTAATGE